MNTFQIVCWSITTAIWFGMYLSRVGKLYHLIIGIMSAIVLCVLIVVRMTQ